MEYKMIKYQTPVSIIVSYLKTNKHKTNKWKIHIKILYIYWWIHVIVNNVRYASVKERENMIYGNKCI